MVVFPYIFFHYWKYQALSYTLQVSNVVVRVLKSRGIWDHFTELQMPAWLYNHAENVWTYRRNRNFMEKELLKDLRRFLKRSGLNQSKYRSKSVLVVFFFFFLLTYSGKSQSSQIRLLICVQNPTSLILSLALDKLCHRSNHMALRRKWEQYLFHRKILTD